MHVGEVLRVTPVLSLSHSLTHSLSLSLPKVEVGHSKDRQDLELIICATGGLHNNKSIGSGLQVFLKEDSLRQSVKKEKKVFS